ncbi:MAG: hypothetical protein AB2L11_03375 [Syntrophobacteraceae bacterium]
MQNSSPDQTWRIEHQCPQCGASVDLEETDRILSCSYCRTRLYISLKGHGAYYLAPPNASEYDLLFIPYWRFRGMVFSCEEQDIGHRIADSSLLALKLAGLPPSLGMRPQALKLKFATPETVGTFLKPQFTLKIATPPNEEDPVDLVVDSGRTLPGLFEAFIGETVSLIYSPVFMQDGVLYDAILKRPLARSPEKLTDKLPADPHGVSSLLFIPTLCPRCGWDLEGEKDTLILLCRNCDSAWKASGDCLEPVDFGVLPCGVENPALCLPFWRMEVQIKGIKLQSYADLIKLANIPKAIREEWAERSLHFWVPAFKVHPLLFLRLGKLLMLSQLQGEIEESLPKSHIYPVTLSLREAAESLKVGIASLAVPKSYIIPKLSKMEIKLDAHRLIYLPFTSRGSEFIQPTLQMSINKNSLKLGRLV